MATIRCIDKQTYQWTVAIVRDVVTVTATGVSASRRAAQDAGSVAQYAIALAMGVIDPSPEILAVEAEEAAIRAVAP